MTNRFLFQGKDKKSDYFEGWYVKTTDSATDFSIALIPGVSHFSESQSFIQYNIFYNNETYSGMVRFSRDSFEIAPEPYSILMPKFIFDEKGVKASLEDNENQILVDLDFCPFLAIEQTIYAPTIMGPFEYMIMPCSHDIVSMRHDVKGKVILNGEVITIDSGVGYIEKDRGHTFPSRYIWLHSNIFDENKHASLFLSVADIKKGPMHFTGMIGVFHDGEKEYRFATYLGSKVEVISDSKGETVKVILKNRNERLTAEISLTNGSQLIAPMNNEMDFPIKETVKAATKVLFEKKNGPSVTLTTELAAAEVVNWD